MDISSNYSDISDDEDTVENPRYKFLSTDLDIEERAHTGRSTQLPRTAGTVASYRPEHSRKCWSGSLPTSRDYRNTIHLRTVRVKMST